MGIWKSKNPPPSSTFSSRKSQNNNTLTNTRGKTAKYEQSPYPNLARNLWESGQVTPKQPTKEEMYKRKCVGTTGKCQDAQTVVHIPNHNPDAADDGEIGGQQPPILLLVPDDHGRNGPPDLFYPAEVTDEQKAKASSWKPPAQDKKSSIYAWEMTMMNVRLEQSERAKQAAGGFYNEDSKQTIKWDEDDVLELEMERPRPQPQPQTSMSIPVPLLEHSLIILDPANLNICLSNPAQSPVSHLPQTQNQNNKEETDNKGGSLNQNQNQNPDDPPPIINYTTDLAPLHKIKRDSSPENGHKDKEKENEKTLRKNQSSRQYQHQHQNRRSNRRYHRGRDRTIADGGRGERRKNIDTDKAIKDRILSALHGNREYYKHLKNARILTDKDKERERDRERERERERERDDERKNSRSRRQTAPRHDLSSSSRHHEKSERHVKELERERQSKKHGKKNKSDETEEEDENEKEREEEEDEQTMRNTRPSTSKNSNKRKLTTRSNRNHDSRPASGLESHENITEKNIKSIAQLLLEGLNQANKKYSKTIEENSKKNENPREIDIEKELRRGGNNNSNNINNNRDRDSSRKKLNFNEALARHISKSHLRFNDFPPFESRPKKGEREREREQESSSDNDNDNHSSRSRRKKKIPVFSVKKSNLKKESRQPSTRVGNTKVKNNSKKGNKSKAKESDDETTNDEDDDEDELNNSPSLTDVRYLPGK